jgi:transcriptional antiterminator NusG
VNVSVPEGANEMEAQKTPMKFYVIRAQSNREEYAMNSLRRKIAEKHHEDLFGKILIPTERIQEIKGGKKVIKRQRLFPGYLLVEMVYNEETWYTIMETPGIGDFIGQEYNAKLAPGELPALQCMEAHEVDRILRQQIDDEDDEPELRIDFKVGDSIKIKEGPFENFDGTVDGLIPSKGLVRVIVTIFGRATPVELEYWQVESV